MRRIKAIARPGSRASSAEVSERAEARSSADDRPVLSRIVLSLALLLAVGFIAGHSIDRINWLRSVGDASTMPPEIAAMSGIHAREVVLPARSIDGNWWIMHTESMIRAGDWRVRETDRDNAPFGREVHWSSGLMWLLASMAWVNHLVTGSSAIDSVQHAALFVGPIMHLIFILMFAWAAARRWGGIVGGFVALAMATLEPLQCFFWAGEADHHGIVICLALGSVLAVLAAGAGRVRRSQGTELGTGPIPTRTSARRWMILSGLLGATGLWVSAATLVPILVGVSLGAVVAAWMGSRLPGDGDSEAAPELWRVWSRAGALGSVAFYLLEYAPFHLGWRLEVNHPLHALAWWGGGELLVLLCGWIQTGNFASTPRQRGLVVLASVGVLTLPVTILLAGSSVFSIDDRFLWTLHEDYITEFQSTISVLAGGDWVESLILISVWPLLALPAGWYLLRRPIARSGDILLAVAICAALPLTALSLQQFRWSGGAQTIWLCLAVVGLVLWQAAPRKPGKLATVGCILVFTMGLSVFPYFAIPTWGNPTSIDQDPPRLLAREVAWGLRVAWGPKPMVVVSGPSTTTDLLFFADASGLGTLYWENVPGLKATAAIYGATSADEALALCIKHNVTHIVVFSWDVFAQPYARLHHERPIDASTQDCFVDSLLAARQIPRWVRPFPYRTSPELEKEGEWALIFEIHPDQTQAEQHYHLGKFLLKRNRTEDAIASFARAWELDSSNAAVGYELGLLLLSTGRTQETREIASLLPPEHKLKLDEAIANFAE